MLRTLIVSMLAFQMQSAFAAEPTSQQVSALSAKAKQIRANIEVASARKKMADKNLDDAKERMNDAIKSKKDLVEAGTNLKLAQAKKDEADQLFSVYNREAEEAVQESRQALEGAQAAATQRERDAKQKIVNEKRDLESLLQRTQIDILRGQFRKESMGREMDQLDIGRYVEAKVGMLMNSNLFCRAAYACSESKGQPLTNDQRVKSTELESEVFKGATHEYFRSTNFMNEVRRAAPTSTSSGSK